MILPNIEHYIEFIAGQKDKHGKTTYVWNTPPGIKLANYDVGFVESVAEQLAGGLGLTDKQATLVDKLISTYARQLAKLGIDQPDHKNYRLGLRTINRSQELILADNRLLLRFPYNEQLIGSIREFSKTSQGRVIWDHTLKVWSFALTEYNLSWVATLAKSNNIELASDVNELFNLILEQEATPFAIELKYDGNKCYIENAPESMLDYIEKNIGFDNIYTLVDCSGALGYTVSPEIADLFEKELGQPFMKLCSEHVINMTPNSSNGKMEDILEWAIAVNRLPIVVYNPNFLKIDMSVFKKYFDEDEIQIFGMKDDTKLPIVVDPKVKILYSNKVLPTWQGRLPLLISYANLMHGASKRRFLENSEKVIYYCEPLPKR